MSQGANVTSTPALTEHDAIDVAGPYVAETLDLYEDHSVFLTAVRIVESGVTGTIELKPYPFTRPGLIDYVPASMLLLYLSQLGYVYVRLLAEDLFPKFSLGITTADFFRLRDGGNIVFTGFDHFRFHRKIALTESVMEISLRLTRMVHAKNITLGRLKFSSSDSSVMGRTQVAIIRETVAT